MNLLNNIWDNIKFNPLVYKKMNDNLVIFLKQCDDDCIILEGIGKDIFLSVYNKENYYEFVNRITNNFSVDEEFVKQDVLEFLIELVKYKIGNVSYDGLSVKEFDLKENKYDDSNINDDLNLNKVQSFYKNNNIPYKLFLELTYSCNLRCKHCYLGEETKIVTGHIQLKRYKELLDELESLGLVELVITGGEATIHKDFKEIIEYAISKNILITLLTNGTNLSKEYLNKLITLGIHDIRISLYGLKSYHDVFVSVDGAFNKSVNALKYLRLNSNIGTAVSVLNKDNLESMIDLREYLIQFKIPLAVTPLIFPTIYGEKLPLKLRLDSRELKKAIKEFKIKIGGTICTAGISRFRITPMGEVNPCEMLRHINLGSIIENSFNEILRKNERKNWISTYRTINSIETKCSSCKYKPYCSNCMGLSFLENGKLESISPFACSLAIIQYNTYEEV